MMQQKELKKPATESHLNKLKEIMPGILFCLLIAVPAWLAGKSLPLIGGPVLGILGGILVGQFIKTKQTANGIRFTSKKILQYAIILLGFDLNLMRVIQVGGQSLFVMLFTLTAAFLTAWFVGRLLHINGKTTTLIGVGTAICGGSAIAATAPVIGASDEDVAQAISTIFLFNIAAVFIFPAIGGLIGMGDNGFGLWAGTAINDTSSVVAAATSWSSAVGNDTALKFATIVKLTRTLMIVPITLGLAVYTARKAARDEGLKALQDKEFEKTQDNSGDQLRDKKGMSAQGKKGRAYSMARVFPWFVVGFLIASLIQTIFQLPVEIGRNLVMAGKFMIVMAMTAIGLNTNLKKLLTQGARPVLLGLCCWFAVAVTSLLVQKLSGTW